MRFVWIFQKENKDKLQHEAPEVVSFEHFPAESSPDDVTNEESTTSTPVNEDRNHAIAVAEATAAAAEAAVVAAQAAARVVRLAGYGRQYSKEERASTIIQSHYRGYLVSLHLSNILLIFFLVHRRNDNCYLKFIHTIVRFKIRI